MQFHTPTIALLTLTLSTSTLACIEYIATYTNTASEPHHLLGELWDSSSSSSSGSEPGQPLCTVDSGLDKHRHFEFKCDIEGVRVYATDLGNRAIYEKLDGEVVRLDALSYGSSGFGLQWGLCTEGCKVGDGDCSLPELARSSLGRVGL